jgi:hypothetical protein
VKEEASVGNEESETERRCKKTEGENASRQNLRMTHGCRIGLEEHWSTGYDAAVVSLSRLLRTCAESVTIAEYLRELGRLDNVARDRFRLKDVRRAADC